MEIKLILILILLHYVENDVNNSVCMNDECKTLGIVLSDKIYEPTTDNDLRNDFSSKKEKKEENKVMNVEEPKLKSSSDEVHDEFHVKVPNPIVLTVLDNGVDKNINRTDMSDSFLLKKENGTQLITENPLAENITEATTHISTTEITTETTTKLSTNTTKDLINATTSNTTKDIYQKPYFSKNQSEICICDLKVNVCDINCCCDKDCNENMKTVFTTCLDSGVSINSQFCFNSKSIFKNNLETHTNKDGLLCVVRNNLHPHVQFTEEMIIDNLENFNKRISRKKFYSYSPVEFESPKMSEIPYRYGDIVWSFSQNKTFAFGVPKQSMSMKCKSREWIYYLKNFETECLHLVPDNREKCVAASNLAMNYFLRDLKLIKSPALVTAKNSTDKVCSNKTCIPIVPYVCSEDPDISACVKSSPRHLLWDGICRNIVSSVEYRIYHNGTDGIKEARAYFTLNANQKEQFLQKIKVKFFWMKTPTEVFTRSGNPGYIIGKPIISGRKVYSSNETMSLKKEAIELSYYPEDWLTVVGAESGVCSPHIRRPVGFGENAVYSCFIELEKRDYLKKKCIDLQNGLFNLLLGDDFTDVKTNNNLNKFVATFGNSEVENTGDWVQVIIDTLPMISNHVTLFTNSDFVLCKNIISDLFIDIAYSKVGSFDKPQNKILGVRMHFGSPKNFVYYINPNCTDFESRKNIKLSTYVHFIDLTREPHVEFAETPGFEAKLPHDFFYPFFSRSCTHFPGFFVVLFVFVVRSVVFAWVCGDVMV